jgi:cysteinyl-tRNA synthetase
MDIKLFNSLSKIEEKFVPISEGRVGMYVCGPTVYDRPHIGNVRSMVVYDILFRVLRFVYGVQNVTYVRNITDVDDKINNRARALGISIQDLTKNVIAQYMEDMLHLNCLRPTFEPKATEHIADMIHMISQLLEKKHAYVSGGHVFFEVMSFTNYTQLTGRHLGDMLEGVRIEKNSYKRNQLDFVLWKPVDDDDDPSAVFDSPWGKGRPGWHIECSAMSTKFLGESFDIHGGGVDLIFPHHTNEIAQSCACNPKSLYAKYWVHNGFLMVESNKMSKSLGNFLTVHDLLKDGVKGEVIRFVFLTTHYRKPLNWTKKLLNDAKKTLDGFYRIIGDSVCQELSPDQRFLKHLYDDLNTPALIGDMHELSKEYYKASDSNTKNTLASSLYSIGRLLGLFYTQSDVWFQGEDSYNNDFVEEMIQQRIAARQSKNWLEADKIRNQLKSLGVILDDHSDGTTTWYKEK